MSWMDHEPVRGGYPDPRLLALSGLERMRAGDRRQMPPPPIHHLFGLRPLSASPASVTFTMPCSPQLQSTTGVFFAGTSALVADSSLGGAIATSLGPGQIAVTSDLSLNFLRPVGPASKHLVSRGRPIEVGRRLGLAEALVEDGQGRIVAHGTTRCFISSVEVPPLEEELPVVEWPTYDTPDPYERPVREGAVDPEIFDRMDFSDVIERQRAGEMPYGPFAELFGLSEPRAGDGRFSCRLPASPWFSSPAGTIYGGVLAYIVDSVLAGAMGSALKKEEVTATLDLKVQFLRPVWPDGQALEVEGEVVHRGRSFAAAQGRITNADGKTVALGHASAAIRSGTSWGSFAVADEAPTMAGTSSRAPGS